MKLFFVAAALSIALLLPATAGRAQELTVTDRDANILMQVKDEGDAGSISLPPSPAAPADTTDKLHNVNGVLYWQDAQLGAWNRTGTDVHLANPGDSVGIGIAAPTGGARLEVAGQVKITGGSPGIEKVLASGDAEGLAAWMTLNLPKIVSAQGNQYVCFCEGGPGANLYEAQILREATIAVPGPGTVLAQATGYMTYDCVEDLCDGACGPVDPGDPGDDRDLLRYWFWPHPSVFPSDWEWPDFHNLGIISREVRGTDSSARDTDVYHPFSLSKTYPVTSAQNFTVRFCGDKPWTSNKFTVADVAMQLIFFPDAATALTP